jgi:hypothetical protein
MNTFIRNDLGYDEAIENIFKMVSDLPNDKLKENYSKENLKVDEWIGVSLFAGGFSSIAYRDIWNNNCRILNRFYKKPEYRFENKNRRVSEETKLMISQQLEVAKKLGYDCAFMSREMKQQAFNHYKKYLPQEWFSSNDRYLMYYKGYQHIMWTPLNNNKLIMEKE